MHFREKQRNENSSGDTIQGLNMTTNQTGFKAILDNFFPSSNSRITEKAKSEILHEDLPRTVWDGENCKPLTVEQYLEPQLHPQQAYKSIVANTRSFTELLAPRIDLGNGRICLQDLSSMGRVFNVVGTNTEARTPESIQALSEKVIHAISQVVPQNAHNPWIMQWFVQDNSKAYFKKLIQQIQSYAAPPYRNSAYSTQWLKDLTEHFSDLTEPKGLFEDPNSISGHWRGRNRIVRLFIWKTSVSRRPEDENSLDQICEQLRGAFAQAETQIVQGSAAELYEWLTLWFVPKPDPETGCTNTLDLLEKYPWKLNDLDSSLALISNDARVDLGRASLHGVAPWTWKRPGIWWFRGYPSRFLTMDNLTSEPEIGHLTAERAFGNSISTLWDWMPENAIWSMTIVFTPQAEIQEKISRVNRNSVGDDPSALEKRRLANLALGEIARGNPIFRVFCGIFLFGSDLADLNKKTESVLSFLSAHQLRMIAPRYDPIALDSYVRALPFGYDPHQDQRIFARRARMWYTSHIARMVPVYGRSRGTGKPGILLFNRGAEPLLFDLLNPVDRAKNAHSLILGPTGSGKTALLIYFLLHSIAVHRPRIYLITALPTFGLLADHCEKLGLIIHRVKIDGVSEVSLPPFANAQKLLDSSTDKSNRSNEQFDSGDLINRDLLGEMEIQARLMITGGNRHDEQKLRRDDLNMIRTAITDAAMLSKSDNRSHTLTRDVVAALRNLSNSSTETGQQLATEQHTRAARMASSMNLFCTGLNGQLFDQEGELWPEADITLVELDLLARKGYEDRLAVALTGLFGMINNRVEAEQYTERQTVVVIDEAHILLQNPLVSPYINRISATWRTFGAWLWTATQNLRQIPVEAKELLNQPEWWFCLSVDRDEIEQIGRFKTLSTEQVALLHTLRKAPGLYTEGSVISTNLTAIFRSVPPAIALALAQTEKSERAQRAQLMKKYNISEIDAAYRIADEIRKNRRGSAT